MKLIPLDRISKIFKPSFRYLSVTIYILIVYNTCSFAQIGTKTNLSPDTKIDFDVISSSQGVDFTIPTSHILFNNINTLPDFNKNINIELIKEINHPTTIIRHGYKILGASAGGYGPPLPGKNAQKSSINNEADITSTIEKLNSSVDFNFLQDEDKTQWNNLPFEFKKLLLEFILNVETNYSVVKQFIAPIENFSDYAAYSELILPWKERELIEFSSIDLIDKIDLRKISYATRLLLESTSQLLKGKDIEISNNFERCRILTSYGEIGIFGKNTDEISGNFFLAIDFGGNDIYSGNIATTSVKMPVSIAIDFSGDDTYNCNSGHLVAGISGIAILFELDGDDEYHSGLPGLAFSLFGSSLLYDYNGDDKYYSNSNFSQGAAIIGVSSLIDLAGNDEYYSKNNSQAYGGTLGIGMLIDNLGDDLFTSISNKNYSSFVQGAGYGRWGEATDGHSLGGGYGIFINNKGDDEYFAKSFSMGASYYFSLGLFSDNEGHDTYNALSHSQGYAAHYGLASFIDCKGDDLYNKNSDALKITQIIGSGRDYSCGWFIDENGDDNYYFGNRSLAIGDRNGIGIFEDKSGDDTYNWIKNNIYHSSPSIGQIINSDKGMSSGSNLYELKINSQGISIDTMGINNINQVKIGK